MGAGNPGQLPRGGATPGGRPGLAGQRPMGGGRPAGNAQEIERQRMEMERYKQEDLRRQQELELAKQREAAGQAGQASMFPREAPGGAGITPPTGLEEATFRRQEITAERDRTGRREEIFRDFQRGMAQRGESGTVAPGGAVERGATVFGAPFGGAGQGGGLRSGVVFGPGRTTRMPERGTPEYEQMINKMRSRR